MYQLLISLNDITPSITRTITVPEKITLNKLHRVIQAVMGWKNYHLYYFDVWEDKIGDLLLWDDYPADDNLIQIDDKLIAVGDTLSYMYDMGDSWGHTITLKAILPDTPESKIQCLEASRACPPEDCGGIKGYYDILRILDHFGTEEYNEMMVWLDGWHPENIILGNINRRLKKFSK